MSVRVVSRLVIPIAFILATAGVSNSLAQDSSSDDVFRSPVQTSTKIVYVVPKHPAIEIMPEVNRASYGGIGFSGPGGASQLIHPGGKSEILASIDTLFRFSLEKNLLEAWRESTSQVGDRKLTSFTKYYVDASVDDWPGGFTMTLVPKKTEIRHVLSGMASFRAPIFTEEELYGLLSHGGISFEFEANAFCDADSLFDKFKRALGGGNFRSFQKSEGNFPFPDKLPNDVGWPGSLSVKFQPTDGGSKVTGTANIRLYPTSVDGNVRTVVDVGKVIDDALKKIVGIAKN